MVLKSSLVFRFAIVLVFLGLLSACGSKDGEEQVKKTQVVAQVNGDEISIHQVNQRLSRLGALDEEQTQTASKQILRRLVDMQLLKQKAIDAELDRNPQVLQAIEASKTEILAQAYIQNKMLKNLKPSADEIKVFYDEHPELFSDRRIFNLQELAIKNAGGQLGSIEEAVSEKANISQVAEWLKEKGMQFSLNANVRAAEQLPSKLLAALKSHTDGDMITVVNGESVNVISIAASEKQSVSLEKATPLIEKYYENKRRKDDMQKQMDVIKNESAIKYIGMFAEMNTEEPLADDKVNEEAGMEALDAKVEDKDGSQSSLEKGLAGF